MKELEVIDRLRKAFPGCGIGDDAAVLPAPRGEMLFAADAAVEGVHFDRRFCTLSQAVQKLVTSNVSDIFAMGGSPGSIVFTAALPAGCSSADVDSIVDGLRRSTKQYGVKLVGGDTVLNPGGFSFNVAITGEVELGRAILRSGAREGNTIVLFGPVGGSLAGLGVLSALFGATGRWGVPAPRIPGLAGAAALMKKAAGGISLATGDAEIEKTAETLGGLPHAAETMRFVRQHLVPLAYPLGPSLLSCEPPCVTAMIDVSDGIAKDLGTLCAESGVGAIVREDSLPVPQGLGELFGLEGSALADFALSSGEEYVLLATVPPEGARLVGGVASSRQGGREVKAVARATAIGTIVPADRGVVLVDGSGRTRPMPKLGYEHAF